MKILSLCDRYPFPMQDGLILRMVNLVRELKSRHTFDLVCYKGKNTSKEIEALFGSIKVFEKNNSKQDRPFGIANPFLIDSIYSRSAEINDYLHGIVEHSSYDMIIDFGGNMLVNLPKNSKKIPLLVDNVDDYTLFLWRQLLSSRSATGYVINLKRLAVTYIYERKYLGAADHCLFVSEEDAAAFRRICPSTPTSVVHNGVDTKYYKPMGKQVDQLELVFEGAMSFPPNADCVQHFISHILPIVRAVFPDIHFTAVGRDPGKELLALASRHISVTGYVDDIRPYLDSAAFFVCPMRTGAGIKNKILQAWAMGKAVVATNTSIGGLNAKEGENIVIRDDPRKFAEAIIQLLRDPDRAKKLGENGRKTVIEHYTWQAMAGQLESVMYETVNKRRVAL